MLVVTAFFASVLALMFIKLTWQVVGLRRKNKGSLGSGDVDELNRAIRAHGNFAEYVPLALFLMGALELNGASLLLVAFFGLLLLMGRYFHAKGMQELPPEFSNRVRGMKLTFAALGLMALSNIAWIGYLFFSAQAVLE
jgi:uncharacterized membrane protein YecN with MAPEG domain